jgi:Ca2+-binding RTX toxin-like protein
VKNTGTATWSRGGSHPLRIGTWNPQDRSSAFRNDWYSANRPTAMSESTVRPGQVATFVFEVRVPENMISAREHFRVVAESKAWIGPVMWRDFSVPNCAGQRPTIVGTTGRDVISGTTGRDVIATFGGDDTIRARASGDVVCAGRGSDTVFGQYGRDTIYGQGGRDTLVGGRHDDTFHGGRHRDVCKGQAGRDRGIRCEVRRTIP